MEGSTVDTTISLTQFKAVTQRATGTRYDVHLDIESDEAIYDVEIDIDPLYNQFLNSAVKVITQNFNTMLRYTVEQCYYACEKLCKFIKMGLLINLCDFSFCISCIVA